MSNLPSIGLKGLWTLRNPYICEPSIIYECIAVRTLADCYLQGDDAYRLFYKAVGLIDGVEVNGKIFNFNEEAAQDPWIVTLRGSNGTVVYVPSNYIDLMPTKDHVPYTRVIMSVDLGAIPDSLSLDSIMTDVKEMVSARMGIKATIALHEGPADKQPTVSEHAVLEAARNGSVKKITNNYVDAMLYKQKSVRQRKHIEQMEQLLISKGVFKT